MDNKFQPKYYANQLTIGGNPDAKIALVTGWTKKEAVWEHLSEESKQKVSSAGQLYSKEGVNFIIRNLFLNPNTGFIVITGIDLSGSLKEFKSFLNKEEKNYIHSEIPPEKVREFVDYFSNHSAAVDLSELDAFLKNFNPSSLPEKWTEKPVGFTDHLPPKVTTLPSEKVGFRVEGKKVSDVWPKVLDNILKFGYEKLSAYGEKQRELIDMITVVSDDDPDNPFLPPCFSFTQKDLINYYPQIMTDVLFEGVEYTYGSRLRNHSNINQIQQIINELKRANYSRRAIAFTWSVEKDCMNSKPPCLDSVQALVQDNTVYLTAYFRSNDMYRAWPQNAFGLLKIQKEIAEPLELKTGKLVIISCSAHIYERDLLEAQKTVEQSKKTAGFEIDSRGNFAIEIHGEEILVNHVDDEGTVLQKFKGKTAKELRDRLSGFVVDPIHAIYLGTELAKAEYAMKNKTDYRQD